MRSEQRAWIFWRASGDWNLVKLTSGREEMSGAAERRALSRVEPERMVLSSMTMVRASVGVGCWVLGVGFWVMGGRMW